jgi:hypothetical protein
MLTQEKRVTRWTVALVTTAAIGLVLGVGVVMMLVLRPSGFF